MDRRWRESRLIDGRMSTLTDGELAGELRDDADADGCFVFVSGSELHLCMYTTCTSTNACCFFNKKTLMSCHSASLTD